MRLWTIQPNAVYDEIQKAGVYRCNSKLSENYQDECFRNAYEWISEKMKEKIGPAPEGVIIPIWAWHTWEGKRRKPDFRNSMFREYKDCCLIEIEIPDEQVLLTDFDSWHLVLNECPIIDEDDRDAFEQKYDHWLELPEGEKEIEMRKSWDALVNQTEDELMQKENISIQAVFWELRKEDVRNVKFHK